ncbi:MAG: hypothetical protein D6805_04475 [Planctomycetota bacterium]|nr:MAG: hypothetical protein D6805_04475 [Planctomycetota bacterium]
MQYLLLFLQITGILAAYTIVYEILRYRIRRRLARRFRSSVRSFLDRHNIDIEKSRFMAKQLVRLELLNDPQIHNAILQHAQEHNLPIDTVRDIVEDYIDEIVPSFNILSYYKIGYSVAKFSLNFLYEVVIDQESLQRLENLPKNTIQVYVMNHRSNADFVLAAYMLSKSIAISFAVGEWARIWPLEELFKSFGSYFVRRGFRQPLYHTVLARYMAYISRCALRQGIFIEGGLSRDGKLRQPKFGLIDYILQSLEDIEQDVIFIPTGINFDWVIEDKSLIAEKKKTEQKRNFLFKLASLFVVLAGTLITIFWNLSRLLFGGRKRFGCASVSFGEPVSARDYFEHNKITLKNLNKDERKQILAQFANFLLTKIGQVIPIPPVPLSAAAFLDFDQNQVPMGELISKIQQLRHELLQKKAKIIVDKEFLPHSCEENPIVQRQIAEKIFHQAYRILKRRKIWKISKGTVCLTPAKKALLQYYANSIAHFNEESPSSNQQKTNP